MVAVFAFLAGRRSCLGCVRCAYRVGCCLLRGVTEIMSLHYPNHGYLASFLSAHPLALFHDMHPPPRPSPRTKHES